MAVEHAIKCIHHADALVLVQDINPIEITEHGLDLADFCMQGPVGPAADAVYDLAAIIYHAGASPRVGLCLPKLFQNASLMLPCIACSQSHAAVLSNASHSA